MGEGKKANQNGVSERAEAAKAKAGGEIQKESKIDSRLLHTSRGRGTFASCLGGELLAGRLASGRLASGLLGTGHGAAGGWKVELRRIRRRRLFLLLLLLLMLLSTPLSFFESRIRGTTSFRA